MESFDFTAIDFETMTSEFTSACALGLVRVENGVIIQKFYSLIKPIPDGITKLNTWVHGITPDMVKNAPTFEELWPSIKRFFEHQTIVAHNVDFDSRVLDATSDFYHINFPIYEFIDSMSYTHAGLAESCAAVGIDLSEHHDALCDATACAQLMMINMGFNPFIEKKKDFPQSKSFENKIMSHDTKIPLDDSLVLCKDSPFFHKKVVFTGNLFSYPSREQIADILRSLGADVNTSISKKTDIVIMGFNAGPSKVKKIEALKEEGYDICVMSEDDLIKALSELSL